MLHFIDSMLTTFRGQFSRRSTWLQFCAIVFCFLGTTEMIGVTSMCRFWLGHEAVYHSLRHFFSFHRLSLSLVAGLLAIVGHEPEPANPL